MIHKEIVDNLLASIEEKANKNHSRRTYLGMSSFGDCKRKQWLDFRHVFNPYTHYTSATYFSDGHRTEDLVIQRLKDAGYELKHEDENGNQIAVSLNSWVKGHLDILIKYDNEWYVADVKSTDPAKKEKLKELIKQNEKTALKKFNKQYYNQAQWYMGMTGIHKCFYLFTGHGGREILNSRQDSRSVIVDVPFNQKDFERLQNEACGIILSEDLPPPMPALKSDMPLCIWGTEKHQKCEAYDYCKHNNQLAAPDCFNCAHVTFRLDGAQCDKHGKELNVDQMQGTYQCHRYHPNLLHKLDIIATDGENIHYKHNDGRQFTNGDSMSFREEINKEPL